MFVAESSIGSLIKIMLNILIIEMVDNAIRDHVLIWVLDIFFIHFSRNVLWKEQLSISKTELNVFMTAPCKNNIQYYLTNVLNLLGLFVFVQNAVILHLKFMTIVSSMQIHWPSGKNLKSTMFLRNSTRIIYSETTGDCLYLCY
jgi:hypothetical protein